MGILNLCLRKRRQLFRHQDVPLEGGVNPRERNGRLHSLFLSHSSWSRLPRLLPFGFPFLPLLASAIDEASIHWSRHRHDLLHRRRTCHHRRQREEEEAGAAAVEEKKRETRRSL